MAIELPAGHVELCRHSNLQLDIAISKCRVNDCANYHIFVESMGHKHNFVYCPAEDEALESIFTVIFDAASRIVVETAVQERRWQRYVS